MSAGKSIDKKRRYERLARLYLQRCYDARTAARVSEFAEFVGLTRTHLFAEIKNDFGIPPRAFLRALQLEQARWLLIATTARPADVGLAAGFGTVNTFYRSFTAKFGMSPEKYRESANRTK